MLEQGFFFVVQRMKYADIAATMPHLNGARVVIIQDVRSWKAKEMQGGGGKLLYESAEDGGCGVCGGTS